MSLFDRLKTLCRSVSPGAAPPRHFFTPLEVGQLHRIQAGAGIDDQTWRDLLLASYEETLTLDASVFGRQMLHLRLREGQDDMACAAQRMRLQALNSDPRRLDALAANLRTLRHADTEVATLPLGWMRLLFALAPLMALQVHYHRELETWNATLRALHALLHATALLGKQGGALLEPFIEARGRAERLHVRVARSVATRISKLCQPGRRRHAGAPFAGAGALVLG